MVPAKPIDASSHQTPSRRAMRCIAWNVSNAEASGFAASQARFSASYWLQRLATVVRWVRLTAPGGFLFIVLCKTLAQAKSDRRPEQNRLRQEVATPPLAGLGWMLR